MDNEIAKQYEVNMDRHKLTNTEKYIGNKSNNTDS